VGCVRQSGERARSTDTNTATMCEDTLRGGKRGKDVEHVPVHATEVEKRGDESAGDTRRHARAS